MKCRIEKLGWRQYYAYYQLDGWQLLGFYSSKNEAINALNDFLSEIQYRKNSISNKYNQCNRYDLEIK